MKRYRHQAAEQKLIRHACIRFDALFPNGTQAYMDDRWDMSRQMTATYAHKKRFLLFRHYWLHKEPLPSVLADLVKAYLLGKHRISVDAMQGLVSSLRILCDVIVKQYGSDLEGFDWSCLDDDFFAQTEEYIAAHVSPGMTYSHLKNILAFVRFLAANGMGLTPTYIIRVRRPESASHKIFEVPNEDGMLPTQAALMGLADVYHAPTTDQDKLLISVIVLTLAGGFRIGEVLSLNVNCVVTGTDGRLGIRYHEEKTKNGRESTQTRWITPEFIPLVQDALDRIFALTDAARQQAILLEAHPDTIPIPEWEGRETVKRADIRKLWGMRNLSAMPRREVPRYGERWGDDSYYKVADIQHWLLARRGSLITRQRADGTVQTLSETLLIAPRFYFRSNSATFHHVIEQIRYGQIRYFLGSGQGKSVFERYGINEPDGTPCRITSHQLRRWTTDTANKGGLSIHQLNLWMKRQDPQHIYHYLKSTLDERRAQLPQDIESGNAYGPLVDLYNESPPTAKTRFDHGHTGSIYVTPFGLCVHDLYSAPCEYHMTCLRGCPDYILVKGDPETHQNLSDLKGALERAITLNETAYQHHPHPNLQARIAQDRQTLTSVQKALHFLEDDAIPRGTQVNPNALVLVDEITVQGQETRKDERTIL